MSFAEEIEAVVPKQMDAWLEELAKKSARCKRAPGRVKPRAIVYPTFGGVYFAQLTAGGRIKIGCAINIDSRLRSLSATCPDHLRLLAFIRSDEPTVAEAEVHKILAKHRAHFEWFEPHADVLTFIRRNAEPHRG